MTKEELLSKLQECQRESDGTETHSGDREIAHTHADDALLDFINDAEITEAFDAIKKWYA